MQCHLLIHGHKPKAVDLPDRLPDEGVLWLDFVRNPKDGERENWPAVVKQLTGQAIEPQHAIDGNNAVHPSFFDGTPRYDLLIFQGLGPDNRENLIESRTAAFFLFDNLVVTVRAFDNQSFLTAFGRLTNNPPRPPITPVGVAHFVLDIMADRYLAVREPMSEMLEGLQENLLDPNNPFNDWRELLNNRRQVRKLEALSAGQLEALDAWRRNSRFEFTDNQSVRINDLKEHVTRVHGAAQGHQADIESAVQLHFSAVAHNTNQIVTALTVISAIFLPLGLLAGIFGMNFEKMPGLGHPQGFWILVIAMVVLSAGGLLWFRRRRVL